MNNYYYDFGGDIYFDDGYVYYGDQRAATEEEFAEQAMAIAEVGATEITQAVADDRDIEWMPLGVFALTHEETGDPTMFLQLNVDKDGTIAGTYFNSSTDQTQTVQGSVDKRTQRAAWTVGDNAETVMETGIFNLTQDETSVLLHFGTAQTQTWLLVRLEDPDGQDSQSGSSAAEGQPTTQ